MANLRYVTTNKLADVTLAASPALESTLPQSNLLDSRRAYVARTTGTAAQAITGDFAVNTVLNCALIWAHNLSDSATWRLRLYSATGQGGSVLYDSTASAPHASNLFDDWPAGRRFAVDYFSEQTTVRSFQLDLTDASNPDGYMQIGQFWLGQYTELSKQILSGFDLVIDDGAKIITPPGGAAYASNAYTGGANRQLKAQVYLNSKADRSTWATIKRQAGQVSQTWVDPFPDDADPQTHIDHAMLGLISARDPIRNRVNNLYRGALTVTEV